MTVDEAVMIAGDAIFLIIKTAAPLLLVSLIVGLIVSIFQTVTSIQEQTLTFIPKILSIFITLIFLGHWMFSEVSNFINVLWIDFSRYIR